MTMPKGYDPALGPWPYRVPGIPPTGVRAARLTSGEFSYGLELLEGTVIVPKSKQWHQMYFDLVKYVLTPADWRRAVTETIRSGNDGKNRMPSPEMMIARAGVQAEEERNPHAGRWVFRCADCGRTGMTEGAPDEPPERCHECEERMAWADGVPEIF